MRLGVGALKETPKRQAPASNRRLWLANRERERLRLSFLIYFFSSFFGEERLEFSEREKLINSINQNKTGTKNNNVDKNFMQREEEEKASKF